MARSSKANQKRRDRAAKLKLRKQKKKQLTGRTQTVLQRAAATQNPARALELYRQAQVECQQSAASAAFDLPRGKWWDTPITRDYLTAVFGTGQSLWRLNKIEDAIPHFQEVWDADCDDHLGTRFWLASCLLTLRRVEELRQVMDRAADHSPAWTYCRALWLFAVDGDVRESRELLTAADREMNIVNHLLGDDPIRSDIPIRLENQTYDAHSTARLLAPAWRTISGATKWLRATLGESVSDHVSLVHFPIDELHSLRQTRRTWHVGLQELNSDDPDDVDPTWLLMVADVAQQEIRCMTIIGGHGISEFAWNQLILSFLRPVSGVPERPRTLVVSDDELHREWQSMLAEIGIKCRLKPLSSELQAVMQAAAASLEDAVLPEADPDFSPTDVPQQDGIWEVAFHQMPMVVSTETGDCRPWSVIIVEQSSGLILCSELVSGEPLSDRLWDNLLRVMQQQNARPARVELSNADDFDVLQPLLSDAHIECRLRDELPELDAFCLQLAVDSGSPGMTATADGKNVTHDDMEDFYAAADHYFRSVPWRHVAGESVLQIHVDGFDARFGIVLGRTGVTLGLVVHESLSHAVGMIEGAVTLEECNGLAVIFDEESILAHVDLHLMERHGWPVSSPEAYPAAMRYRQGHPQDSPTSDDLQWLTCALRTLPDFVANNHTDKTYPVGVNGLQRQTRITSDVRPQRSSLSDDLTTIGCPEDCAVTHVNHKRQTYYLHEGRTKSGKPKYFFSMKTGTDLCSQVPEGFEIYENARGQVFCRRIQPKLILESEINVVKRELHNSSMAFLMHVEAKKNEIIIYEREHPALKFTLKDDSRRLFSVSRWCFRGSVDDWIPIVAKVDSLEKHAARYCPEVGQDSLFEL